MDKKSKILLWVLGLLIIASVGVTYWRIMIKKDYIIEAQTDCDPTTEKCFIYECDPAAETCTGDPVEDTSYYKLINRNAANIPLCDPADESCQALICGEGEKDCEMTLCDETTKVDQGTECSDPEQYNLDNPPVDETATDETVTCDTEADPTCVDNAAATDESSATDATATDATTTDNADAAAGQ